MVNIQWYYGRTGPGQVAEIVSYSVPVDAALSKHANRIGSKARAALASRPKVRTGASQIRIKKHDLDYYVELTDPDGKGGAAGIEMKLGILRDAV